jgi:hypothetical protein
MTESSVTGAGDRLFKRQRWRLAALGGVVLVALVPAVARPAEARWEAAIAAFEADDRAVDYPEDAVLFIGSSSIRGWSTLAAASSRHDDPRHRSAAGLGGGGSP